MKLRRGSILRFTDGEEFDTSGELRIEERHDGLYVVGEGVLVAVDSSREGEELIRRLTERLAR